MKNAENDVSSDIIKTILLKNNLIRKICLCNILKNKLTPSVMNLSSSEFRTNKRKRFKMYRFITWGIFYSQNALNIYNRSYRTIFKSVMKKGKKYTSQHIFLSTHEPWTNDTSSGAGSINVIKYLTTPVNCFRRIKSIPYCGWKLV